MQLDHVTLLVSSLERSMPYYERLLPLIGFRKQRNHVWTDGAGFFFQFLQAKTDAPPYERYGAGMNHLGFGATSPQQVHEIRAAMGPPAFRCRRSSNCPAPRRCSCRTPMASASRSRTTRPGCPSSIENPRARAPADRVRRTLATHVQGRNGVECPFP